MIWDCNLENNEGLIGVDLYFDKLVFIFLENNEGVYFDIKGVEARNNRC